MSTETRPLMDSLTPDLEPRRDVVAVTMRMPDGATAEYVQGFAASAASVLHRMDMHGVMVEATAYLLRVWIPVTGAESRDAAVLEAVRRAEGAAGGWLVVDGAERGEGARLCWR